MAYFSVMFEDETQNEFNDSLHVSYFDAEKRRKELATFPGISITWIVPMSRIYVPR